MRCHTFPVSLSQRAANVVAYELNTTISPQPIEALPWELARVEQQLDASPPCDASNGRVSECEPEAVVRPRRSSACISNCTLVSLRDRAAPALVSLQTAPRLIAAAIVGPCVS